MLKSEKPCILKNEKGMSILEVIPLMILFFLLTSFGVGFFGVVHSGILNSIAARNYAFSTFENRADLTLLRGGSSDVNYQKTGFRQHGVVSEKIQNEKIWTATSRSISLLMPVQEANENSASIHNTEIPKIGEKVSDVIAEGVNPVWIKVRYGMCVTAACGDQ